MHELSIAEGIVGAALAEYAALRPVPARVVSIRVVAGGLHQIVPEFMTAAYEALAGDTPLRGSRLELDIRPLRARCRACAWEGEVASPFFVCAACEGMEVDVLSGRELYLESLHVEQDDDAAPAAMCTPGTAHREKRL